MLAPTTISICRADRVYLTTDPVDASIYAALAPGGRYGDVYEVEPLSELEPEPSGALGAASYTTRAAIVVAVARRAVRLEEAIAQMRAFADAAAAGGNAPMCV